MTMPGRAAAAPAGIALGIRENRAQFLLLILINAFVGGMVGLERTVVPLIGSESFQLASASVVTGFIVSFGIVKGLTNLVSDPDRRGLRRRASGDAGAGAQRLSLLARSRLCGRRVVVWHHCRPLRLRGRDHRDRGDDGGLGRRLGRADAGSGAMSAGKRSPA
jgi:hypothetical protein